MWILFSTHSLLSSSLAIYPKAGQDPEFQVFYFFSVTAACPLPTHSTYSFWYKAIPLATLSQTSSFKSNNYWCQAMWAPVQKALFRKRSLQCLQITPPQALSLCLTPALSPLSKVCNVFQVLGSVNMKRLPPTELQKTFGPLRHV